MSIILHLNYFFWFVEFVAGMPSKIINKTAGVEFTDPLEGFNHLNEVAGQCQYFVGCNINSLFFEYDTFLLCH